MVSTKYYDVIKAAQAVQKPAADLPAFDRERARTKGFGAKLVTRFLENPRWLLGLIRKFRPNVKLGPFVLVTRNADVREVLERQDVFETPFAPEMSELAGGSNFVLGMPDGETYRRMKSSILSAFPPAEVEARVRSIAAVHSRQIMQEAFPGVDVVGRLLRIVPARICREYYGMLIDDEAEFTDWAIALSSLFFADFFGSAVTREMAVSAAAKLDETLNISMEAVRDGRIAADTPLARLVAMHDAAPSKLSMPDLRSIMLGMISGFVPTNILASGNALDVVLSKPEARAAIEAAIAAKDDAALDRAVMEAMRFKPINIGPMRVCNTDTVIAKGTRRAYEIKAGATVWPSTLSAMFDPEAVDKPEEFNPDRPARDSMVFGHGIHWCIGSAIARVQIAESFKAVFSNPNVSRMRGRRGKLSRLGAFPEHLCVWFDRPQSSRLVQHALVTAVVPLARAETQTEARLQLAELGNPVIPEIQDEFRKSDIIHFCSVAIAGTVAENPDDSASFVLEMSGDGAQSEVIAAFAAATENRLRPILKHHCSLGENEQFAAWIARHVVNVGPGQRMGVVFSGTPGHSVKRIRQEEALQAAVRDELDILQQRGAPNPLALLRLVRRRMHETGAHEEALKPAASLLEMKGGGWKNVAWRLFTDPWFDGFLAVLMLGGCWLNKTLLHWTAPILSWLGLAETAGALALASIEVIALLAAIVAIFLAFLQFGENRDAVTEALPDEKRYDKITRNENKAAQNHLTGLSVIKPGFVRWLALRVVYIVIALAGRYAFRPGYLADINTIHFARWVRIPGTDKLLFFSNYGGSWESYLEDFITKANYGLTGVWSNTFGFPRAWLLFFKGATDGDRFKRWARLQQIPTLFWYSAYPNLDTRRIRTNSAIRQGLCEGRTDDDARNWLAQFGSLRRPAERIETGEVQAIAFGPMGKLPSGTLVALRVPESVPVANRRQWMAGLREKLAFGDAMPKEEAAIAAFSPSGFRRFGMQFNAVLDPLDSFPLAFRQGMHNASRARILGDAGKNAPPAWTWGNEANPVDVVVALYGKDEATAIRQARSFVALSKKLGLEIAAEIPLTVTKKDFGRKTDVGVEPFGFADGISQPIMRGTPRATFPGSEMHRVAAGEFLYGYADERGCHPPSVMLAAGLDRNGHLPVAITAEEKSDPSRHDFARNGSFLVVRQLQQHVSSFDAFCQAKAAELKADGRGPEGVSAEWIGAKMVGRWKDGSSLVRNPYHSQGRPIDNDFAYGEEDPQGLKCPLGAHVRRANPRDSLGEDRGRQTALAKRHKILRIGRAYTLPGGKKAGAEQGLMFMCLNADIERQFEFMQQTWVAANRFHGLDAEQDPLLGPADGRFTIPVENGKVVLRGLGDFVTMRGGGYFFMPGKRSIDFMISRL